MGSVLYAWDKTGPNIFYVDFGETHREAPLFFVGNASKCTYGVLDLDYKYDITPEKAMNTHRWLSALLHAQAQRPVVSST